MKERIIGAAVLVVFAVLIVPVYLDGPPAEGEIVTERVLLPGQEGQETQTIVLERDRTDPVPAAAASTPPRQEEATPQPASEEPKPVVIRTQAPQKAPEKAPEKSAERPAPKPAATEPAISSTGMWAVQIGSYSNKDNAEKVAADLRKQGYAAFLSQIENDQGQLHRVRIGPQKDRASAEAMASRLAKVGHKGQVMPHP